MKWNLILMIVMCLSLTSWGQRETVIDQQILANGKLIKLTANSLGDENKKYAIECINRLTNDTIVNYIDSVQHAHCSPPNSIFFINDSIGFFTESGGCYASYNWLFRTTDMGLTWKFIESGSRTDGNSFRMLNNESFYMFNELNGIIVWEIKEGKLVYSITKDGGVNWTTKTQSIMDKSNTQVIQSISFSVDGQVTLVCGDKFIVESGRKRVSIIQSNDFGKSFHKLK